MVLTACTKQPAPGPEDPLTNKTVVGKIINTGLVAADGCGYLVRTETGQELKPLNLSADFQQDGIDVVVTYRLNSEPFSCGLLPTILTAVTIVNITKL
ncbi:hypothetical protein M23134_02891 [Microscilla marina ATCC 23134]|uniref:Uncharacterized protein n=2 Tax=Microscilla marina TaxID=1027 RepID=A1ZPY9_MICM2|nr:hypothetical protein M23134_02891 [Microscilla marina ATCC 23134]